MKQPENQRHIVPDHDLFNIAPKTEKKSHRNKYATRRALAAAALMGAGAGLAIIGQHVDHQINPPAATKTTEVATNPDQLAELQLTADRQAVANEIDSLNDGTKSVLVFTETVGVSEGGQFTNPILIETTVNVKNSNDQTISVPTYAMWYVNTQNSPDFRTMDGSAWLENQAQTIVINPIDDLSTIKTTGGELKPDLFTKGQLNSEGELFINTDNNQAALVGFIQTQNPQ